MAEEMRSGALIWFTGIPASGKSTIASAVERQLKDAGIPVAYLDSEFVRRELSPDLGYTIEARAEHTRRLSFVGRLLAENGIIAIVAAVSNLRAFRDRARAGVEHFVEAYVKCPLAVCQARDPKGLYARAARGEIRDIAGLHLPYEPPLQPEVLLETDRMGIPECTARVLAHLSKRGLLSPETPQGGGKEEASFEVGERIRVPGG
ncbi:MAG: adenylyl-sulfate kinase [Deltaproteobacteria bacterium]|nr:MAG: adenylyl-sulfate kinase [Deltaproteobacteria bacterium]